MFSSNIEHKLKVFISSKCGGKYTIVRKALKKMLNATGLIETYVFESDAASSEDTKSAYLNYIDESNLCVFLIDNKDGAPPAVLSEERRAKDKNLHLLYFFCDENEKEPTAMQKALLNTQSQKYQIVHEFSDFTVRVYDDIMQDIIAKYKRQDDNKSQIISNVLPETQTINQQYSEMFFIKNDSFSAIEKIGIIVAKKVFLGEKLVEESQNDCLTKLLIEQLRFVICEKEFNEKIIDEICDEMQEEQDDKIKELLKLRFNAQKLYYNSNLEKCLIELQSAIKIAIESDNIPVWIVNDIAIDIRYVCQTIDDLNNKIDLNNIGQQYINKSGEPVYFPYVDRQIEKMNEEICNRYYISLNESPYSSSFNGLQKIFLPLSKAFCIAEMHGSIVQTEITRDRLISIYSMLCTLYDQHDIFVQYIKFIIINRDKKKLNDAVRTCNPSIDCVNNIDINKILDDIQNIPNEKYCKMSKYLLISHLGYFMDDPSYQKLYKELVDYSMAWINEGNRLIKFSTYMFDFFINNLFRANKNHIIEFVKSIFDNKLARFYDDCFKLIKNIDFSKLSDDIQSQIKQILIDVASGKINIDSYTYKSAVISFCKSTTLPIHDLEIKISKQDNDFYRNVFLLEISKDSEKSDIKFIKKYLKQAKSRNELQGKKGVYHEYADEPFETIYNLITIDKLNLEEDIVNSIVSVGLSTLETKSQTVGAKLSAVKIIQLLYFLHPTDFNWNNIFKQMVENSEVYSNGYEEGFIDKRSNYMLNFSFLLFISCKYKKYNNYVTEKLFSLDPNDSYNTIQFLKIIITFLKDSRGSTIQKEILLAFLFNCINKLKHKESDVRYFSILCLMELTNFKATKNISLTNLYEIMCSGTMKEKIAILNGIQNSRIKNKPYIKQILNQGKADNNYVIRTKAHTISLL